MAIRCLLVLSLALPLWGKDLNPKDFPETLIVSEGRMETSITGIKQDGMCADPQDDFSKGFCRAYGRKSTVQYESIGITIGTIGDTKYTLEGTGFFAHLWVIGDTNDRTAGLAPKAAGNSTCLPAFLHLADYLFVINALR